MAILGTPEHLVAGRNDLVRLDLEGRPTILKSVARPHIFVALDPTESIVATGGRDGTVGIGSASGGEPHLFFGHTSQVWGLAFSPDGRWLASGADDNAVRVWRVPDVAKTPLHKLSQEEALTKLRAWTNLRVVPDDESSTRWRLEPARFPGWAKVPGW